MRLARADWIERSRDVAFFERAFAQPRIYITLVPLDTFYFTNKGVFSRQFVSNDSGALNETRCAFSTDPSALDHRYTNGCTLESVQNGHSYA